MAYYKQCPNCGANLDPGETCECQAAKAEEINEERQAYKQFGNIRFTPRLADEKGLRIVLETDADSGQMLLTWGKKNTDRCNVGP